MNRIPYYDDNNYYYYDFDDFNFVTRCNCMTITTDEYCFETKQFFTNYVRIFFKFYNY